MQLTEHRTYKNIPSSQLIQQRDTLVHFFSNPAHFGAHVANKEEAHSGCGHDDFSNPESHVPTVLFGNSAEGKTRHESSNWNTDNLVKPHESLTILILVFRKDLPFAINATTAWEVPQKLDGALSLAITPNKAIGP